MLFSCFALQQFNDVTTLEITEQNLGLSEKLGIYNFENSRLKVSKQSVKGLVVFSVSWHFFVAKDVDIDDCQPFAFYAFVIVDWRSIVTETYEEEQK